MSDDDWIGCLVLVVAPEPYADQVAMATKAVESTIFNDPVLVDLARVAQAPPRLLDAAPGKIAARLRVELVMFARSPSRNPAPRCTFCVLVLHPDEAAAEELVRELATTAALSDLPVMFRISVLPQKPGEPGDGASVPAVTRAVLDAITATAHEVDKTPDFSLPVDQVDAAVRRRRPVPGQRREEPEHTAVREHSPVLEQAVVREKPRSLETAVAAMRAVEERRDPAMRRRTNRREPRWPAGQVAVRQVVRLSGAVVDRLRRRRPVPASNIEVITELSGRTERVSLLYLVFVAEPVQPGKKSRTLRAECAQSLINAMTAGEEDAWYVRTFTAGRELSPGRPLPARELLRHKDFPERWGEYLDLYDSAGDIVDSITMDRSSFLRRRVETTGATVVFLAETPPRPEPGAAERLADLSQDATIAWVSFSRGGVVPEELESVDVRFLRHHEDVVEELMDAVRQREEPEPPGEEMTAGGTHRAEG